jgi:hypothetical protein
VAGPDGRLVWLEPPAGRKAGEPIEQAHGPREVCCKVLPFCVSDYAGDQPAGSVTLSDLGARGGRAYGRNQRARRALLARTPVPPPAAPVFAGPGPTTADAVALLDSRFTWLRAAETRRTKRLSPGPDLCRAENRCSRDPARCADTGCASIPDGHSA